MKLRISFLLAGLLRGGTERVVINLSNKLKELQYETLIVATKHQENYWGNEVHSETYWLSSKSFLYRSFLLKKALENQDIIISNIWTAEDYSTYEEFISYLYYPNKLVMMCHSGNRIDYIFSQNKKFSHYINSNFLYVISVCNNMKHFIEKEYCFNNVNFIYNSIDIQHIKNTVLIASEAEINYKYILSVARMDYVKNIPSLIRAYGKSSLRDDGVKLVIVGKNDDMYIHEYNSSLNEINQLNLANDVIFLGEKSNPYFYMSRALFLVMSSRYEGFPMTLLECLATGTPVISYDLQTGPNEVIINEYNGLLVKDQDENELAKAIDRLYCDKELYSKCKSNALASVQKFDVNNIIKEWETLIAESVKVNENNPNKLKVHDSDYLNIHGTFSTKELLDYIENTLNFWTISDYINEIKFDSRIINEFEDNIYGLIERYCFVFKCNSNTKNAIEVNVALEIQRALKYSSLPIHLKNKLMLKTTENIIKQNEAFMLILDAKTNDLDIKNNEINLLNFKISSLKNAKWYRFGKLSKKDKVKELLKYFSNPFLPQNSIRRDLAKIIYKILKKSYKKI